VAEGRVSALTGSEEEIQEIYLEVGEEMRKIVTLPLPKMDWFQEEGEEEPTILT
jgi:hypothetical protein